MAPSDSVSNPAMQRSVVVLPQPLGPRSEKNSPSITSKDRGPTVTWGEYRLVSPLTSSSTLGTATGLAQHLLVPAGEVGAAGLAYLGIVEGHHALEVVGLQAVARDIRREFRRPARRRIAAPARPPAR